MNDPISRYEKISSSLFVRNRAKLAELLPESGMAVVYGSVGLRGGIVSRFVQDHNFFYLTGIDQRGSVLLLFRRGSDIEEILFVERGTEKSALWEGSMYSLEGASAVSGVSRVYWIDQLKGVFDSLMREVKCIYWNEDLVGVGFMNDCRSRYAMHEYHSLGGILRVLRGVKSSEEVALIRRACEITGEGFLEMLGHVCDGCMEYELEGVLSGCFLSRGSRGFAYLPIVASGVRANVLHYTANSSVCQDGELVLVDVGAEYGYYCADMTRTVPVSGRFTARQREVYNAVLTVLKEAKSMLRVGVLLADYEKEVGRVMTEMLIKLGLVGKGGDYRRYFMHRASHHLGLAVHDPIDVGRRLEAGMVLTVEPGIYIPEEGLGVRLENDLLIVEDGVEDLMEGIPIEADAIEQAMLSGV